METTIAFVGQCHTAGYAGVPPDSAFPQVLRQTLEALRPDRRIHVVPCVYQHPADLPVAVDQAMLSRPKIVVIEVVGWLAVKGDSPVDVSKLPRAIRTSYDRMRHFRHVSQTLLRNIPRAATLLYDVQESAFKSVARLLQPVIPRRGRASLQEYEHFVADAIGQIRSAGQTEIVLQGPGAPPMHLAQKGIAPDMVERYKKVRDMAQRVAESNRTLYVDRWDTITGGSYIDGSVRPHARLHSVWGHLLAEQLLAAGLLER